MDSDRQELRNRVEKIARSTIIGTRIAKNKGSREVPKFEVLDEFESAVADEGIFIRNLGLDVVLENVNPSRKAFPVEQRVYIYAVPYRNDISQNNNPFMCRLSLISHDHESDMFEVTSYLTCDLRKEADDELRFRMDDQYLGMKEVDGAWYIL